jgi:serine/threonine-protein kinase RsbW
VPDPSDRVTLTAPATSEALQVLRAVTASSAARLELPFDVVDELRVAVNEAGAVLLDLGGEELHLEIDPAGPDFVATVWTDADAGSWPDPTTRSKWAWQVLVGLCDEAEPMLRDGHPGINLLRRRLGTA